MQIKPKFFIFILALLMAAAFSAGCERSHERREMVETRAAVNQIQERGTVRVGVFRDLPPMSYMRDGEMYGFDVDIARHIAAELLGEETRVECVELDAEERIPALLDGRVDILVSNLSITMERSRQVAFSRPYLRTSIGVLSPEGAVVTDVAELDGRKLIVPSGTTAEAYFAKQHPAVQLVVKESDPAAFAALRNNQGVAMAEDNLILVAWAVQNPGYRLGIPALASEQLIAVAVRQGDTELLSRINDLLNRMQTQGLLEASYRRHMWEYAKQGLTPELLFPR